MFQIWWHLRKRSVHFTITSPLSPSTSSGVLNRLITLSLMISCTISDIPCFSGRASVHLLRNSLATTSWWYPSSIWGMYKISIATGCQRWLMVRRFSASSNYRDAIVSQCSQVFTQSLTATYLSRHQWFSSGVRKGSRPSVQVRVQAGT